MKKSDKETLQTVINMLEKIRKANKSDVDLLINYAEDLIEGVTK